ncbi:ABC transporter D family member 2, chloroplastic [Tanacetum coccineum]
MGGQASPRNYQYLGSPQKAFIQRYCPHFMTAKQLKDIQNFKQEEDESLYQACERYNDLLYKCPTHDINNHQKIAGPSGSGKTSLLRTIAGLWRTGKGKITFYAKYTGVQDQPRTPDLGCTKTPPRCHMTFSKRGETGKRGETPGKRPQEKGKPPDVAPHEAEMVVKKNNLDKISKYRDFKGVFFLPQRPHMVLGTLRQQLLYPTWPDVSESTPHNSKATGMQSLDLNL